MTKCLGCGEDTMDIYLTNEGYCGVCSKPVSEDTPSENALLDTLLLTTETSPDIKILKRIEIITAECVFGMNLFRDWFTSWRDVVGGRSSATQKVLRDARRTVLTELRKEANLVGANAVIAVRLDYSEFSGGGKSMLFVVASGTAVLADLDSLI